jgi:nucleotide-binding universal stress UspA family protein
MAISHQLPASTIAFRNVLFAMDFSAASFRAFPFAPGIALRYGGKVLVAHVVPDDGAKTLSLDERDSMDQRLQASVRAALGDSAENTSDVPYNILVDHGPISARLLAAADACDIDLVVVGEHGCHGMEKLLRGSTAQELACLATKPVLSVGPGVSGYCDFKLILYVTDLLPSSVQTLACALSLAQNYGAELVMLHVNDGDGAVSPAEARPRASEFLRRYEAEDQTSLLGKAKIIVDFGSRTELILEHAEQEGVDLIVMGLHHLGGINARIASHLPGSTPYEVISRAHCPVLLVPTLKTKG